MKPDYIFIGPHKSGTTWIDNYLRYRGDVHLPSLTKETFYFDKRYERGSDWYRKQYGEAAPQHRLCVEVAPSLLDKEQAAQRVARDLPDVTVICTLRNPIDRAVAHYFHHLKGGEPDMGFAAMARKHPELVSNGLYFKNLTMWIDLLGKERVKVIDYDQLNRDAADYCRTIGNMLGLPELVPPDEVLKARINEDGDPSFRLLAKVGRRSAEALRFVGAHKVVNFIRKPAVRSLIYGAPPDAKKKKRVRAEALSTYSEFFADFSRLEELFSFDTSVWQEPTAPEMIESQSTVAG